MLDWLADPQVWISFSTLAALEIVLGIDNLVFLSVLAERLPASERARVRLIGLSLALGLRVVMLGGLSWIMGLTAPVLTLAGQAFSWRDLILIAGGLFLLYKATGEIHAGLEGETDDTRDRKPPARFWPTIVQIGLLDLVFSLDSVITAVGMASQLPVMIAAVLVAIGVMMLAAGPVGAFVSRHPTVRMLALSFLLLIGMVLIADGFGVHIPKGYIYAAIGFSVLVEALNQVAAARKRR